MSLRADPPNRPSSARSPQNHPGQGRYANAQRMREAVDDVRERLVALDAPFGPRESRAAVDRAVRIENDFIPTGVGNPEPVVGAWHRSGVEHADERRMPEYQAQECEHTLVGV